MLQFLLKLFFKSNTENLPDSSSWLFSCPNTQKPRFLCR